MPSVNTFPKILAFPLVMCESVPFDPRYVRLVSDLVMLSGGLRRRECWLSWLPVKAMLTLSGFRVLETVGRSIVGGWEEGVNSLDVTQRLIMISIRL